jgi:hypothetical protein
MTSGRFSPKTARMQWSSQPVLAQRTPLVHMPAVERRARSLLHLASALALLGALAACQPELNVGKWTCATSGDAGLAKPTDPVALPWSTGFEDEFCDYSEVAGFCYAEAQASYTTVTSPVHSGHYAAAFRITTSDTTGHQTRCVRQGALPAAAYYGAWYFVPARATNTALWNLLHFQGGEAPGQHGLWDVSLENGTNGDLELVVFDFLNSKTRRPAKATPIPIGAWFHIELYLKRAADATGQVTLYQDGQLLIDVANLITDDSNWGQWYVGNLSTGLTPRDSTLYVDDVTIRSTR